MITFYLFDLVNCFPAVPDVTVLPTLKHWEAPLVIEEDHHSFLLLSVMTQAQDFGTPPSKRQITGMNFKA